MILRNNSKNEWLNYHQGIDIKAESTFEVQEKEGRFILRMLGHANWVVEVKAEEAIEILKTEEIKAEEKPALKEEALKEAKEDMKKIIEEKPKKRPEIMKELKEKGIKFKVSMKNDELLELNK